MKILVVDDELSMREYLELLIGKWGHQVALASTADEAIQQLDRDPPDVVVCDMKLGNDTGLRVLKAARKMSEAAEVIIITAFGTPASAIEAIREGAYDYITKPFDNEELKLLVERALEKRQIRRENAELRRSKGGHVVITNNPRMLEVWSMVDKVAASPRGTVLITGESGTGKEVVARAIHLRSSRASQPFIPINCAALTEGLLESELFGHVKGAFTGAHQDHPGLLVSAGQGTVFLDEIAEVTPATQVKLLRVLQERKARPVGGSNERPFDARIVAATNKSLEAEVKSGRFREDLFYRLNVITIELPPLRARADDIPMLAKHFLAQSAEELGRPGLHFEEATLEALVKYPFPGNVRQLHNVVERAATLSESDALGLASLPPIVTGEPEERSSDDGGAEIQEGFSLERHLEVIERRYLKEALKRTNSKMAAAKMLGLTFRSFRYRLAKNGLE